MLVDIISDYTIYNIQYTYTVSVSSANYISD